MSAENGWSECKKSIDRHNTSLPRWQESGLRSRPPTFIIAPIRLCPERHPSGAQAARKRHKTGAGAERERRLNIMRAVPDRNDSGTAAWTTCAGIDALHVLLLLPRPRNTNAALRCTNSARGAALLRKPWLAPGPTMVWTCGARVLPTRSPQSCKICMKRPPTPALRIAADHKACWQLHIADRHCPEKNMEPRA